MAAQQEQKGRANALKSELKVHIEETSAAPAEVVYQLLSDLRSHLEWAGERQPKDNYRLLSIEAPEGPASVGTEFSSTGADPMGRFADSSVVTEASRPTLFEFVTEANQTMKKGAVVVWTSVHRYEIEPREHGSRIAYTIRTVRISRLPGALVAFNVPGLRSLLMRFAGSNARRGVRNLARMAEEGARQGSAA
ncbi:MAG TPA: SRPBCC family protein [Actinomycetota bacterium]|nr:SRPBCC family protein [Actinomycetota bacterium]